MAAVGGFIGNQIAGGVIALIAGGVLLALYFIPIKKKAAEPRTFEFKVAGVSFSNEDGTERQDIIRKVKDGGPARLTLKQYTYNGHPAVGVYVNDQQIGNVPADLSEDVLKAWSDDYEARTKVLGSGKEAPFGFLVNVTFK